MHTTDTTELVLLLSAAPGIGDAAIGHVLRRCSVLRIAPDAFLDLSPQAWTDDYGIRRDAAEALRRTLPTLRRSAVEAARRLRRLGVTVLTPIDATYPQRLLERMEDPPAVLYCLGTAAALDDPLVAVANSNGAPEEALDAADRLVAAAVDAGWRPVTGHNRLPYQRAALVALRRGAGVCYVLDRGLPEALGEDLSRELFPAARIWSPAYDPQRDLTLSPFALQDHGLGDHNRRRDDLVFALADAVALGHVRPGGRMERACAAALRQRRPVWMVAAMEPEREREWLDRAARRLDLADAAAATEALAAARAGAGRCGDG